MEITDVTVFKTDASWRNWVFLRIETDGDLVGYGECTLEGRENAVEGAIEDMRRRLVGKDPRRMRELVQLLSRHGYWDAGPVVSSAIGGVEMALWDLLGKRLGVPVHELLGGPLQRTVPVYSNAWYFGAATPDDYADRAEETVRLGYRALKFDPFGKAGFTITQPELAFATACVGAVRAAVGPDVELLIEGHGRFGLPSAIRVAHALEQFSPTFFEEPLAPGDVQGLRALRDATRIPIAVGERCYSLGDCVRVIDTGAVSVLQADVIHVGGIERLLTAAALAEASSVAIAPHNASGPIATAATLQVAAVVPNLLMQEMFAPLDAPWRDLVAQPSIVIEDGYVSVPTGPGLGIELDVDEALRHPFVPRDLGLMEHDSILTRPVAEPAPPVSAAAEPLDEEVSRREN
jgi:galactonate dehydratase